MRASVAEEQAAALSGLPAGEFAETYRYQAVPALAGLASARAIDALARQPEVRSVDIDGAGFAADAESTPLIHADTAHAAGQWGDGVTVAVLDSGIDTEHPDFAGAIAYEKCFLAGVGGTCGPDAHPAEDDNGHGTNVAGIIAGRGTIAPIGVAPAAQLAVYKILDSAGAGDFSDWIAALDDIVANHPKVKVLNMSLQSTSPCFGGPLSDVISALRARGTATFIASGNHGYKDHLTVPACIPDGISVGAVYDSNVGLMSGWKTTCVDRTTAADQVACWSDSDDSLDLLAPGAWIASAGIGGGTSSYRGTSQATPQAAGVAALLFHAMPGISVDELEQRMKQTGAMVTDDLHDDNPSTNRQTPRIDARVALLADANADYDGDGCTNGQEFGPDVVLGGRRNPLNPWDYFNPTHTGKNRITDVLEVLKQYKQDRYLPSPPNPPDTPNPDYTPDTDRSFVGPNLWELGPPDGLERMDDVLAIIHQYRNDCS